MKLAVLGGTFDPPHIGHLFLAEICCVELGYTKVLFVPANIPAHKQIQSGTGATERMKMLKLQLQGRPEFEITDMEIRRGGVSYSIDTIREIKRSYSGIEGNPGLIIGDDLLPEFHKWKEYEALPREADIVVARRLDERIETLPFPHSYLDNPVLPVSSTEIRERIRGKKAFRYLVMEKIYSYIMNEHLYGA